ncbi:SulP family inorganic anion transporter [Bacillus sp. ISL-7]|nr:SulP family inorganic anion transporter [Bacillus sp. ISL-7]
MTNSRHNSNKELIGQGIANMITPLFGGIPATGAIARTATNIKSC